MQGIRVLITTSDDLTDIKFNLYDNDVKVMSDIDQPDLSYMIDENTYNGSHKIELSYYKADNLNIESGRFLVLDENFTTPALNFTITWSII